VLQTNMLSLITRDIDTRALLERFKYQRLQALMMVDTVAAGGASQGKTEVSTQGDFLALFATGRFSTLKNNGGAAQDDGVSHLRGKLFSDDIPIFNDFIPLDLWLTPGRVRDAQDLTGAVSNNLFVPLPFVYVFPANSKIYLDARNDGTFANTYTIIWWGFRIIAPRAARQTVRR
jgi:hypothetical protein